MRFEDLVINQFVVALIYVQLPRSMLQLVDAPLNLAEVLLCHRLEDTDGFEQIRDLDLFEELVEAALEHAILRGFLTETAAAARNKALYIENE